MTAILDHRRILAPIAIDALSGDSHIKGQQISAVDLPDVAQETNIPRTSPSCKAWEN